MVLAEKMLHSFRVPFAILLVALSIHCSLAIRKNGYPKIKSATFLSPEFVLGPGSVVDKYYYSIDWPSGHIALNGFNAEVVDEAGHSVPLHETYLHHWVLARYYQRTDTANPEHDGHKKVHQPDHILVRNSGICQKNSLGQYYGLGSETRGTITDVPDPFGIEVGNPADIPAGYEERWLLNVHAIDTRGVEDRLGCTECRCDLYNITVDKHGQPLRPGYIGGLRCCYDQTQCKVQQGYGGARRSLYLRYTVEWVDWDCSIIPVKIFIFDVTDTGKRLNGSTGLGPENGCQVEYNVESCSSANSDGCIDAKRTSLTMPISGYVIYGVAHQHTGGAGSTLYGEDGRVICTSEPIYGTGKDVGDEAGYIVGMSTCYPEPGSVQITAGENLLLESNYNSAQKHTGVMGLFYILVADRTPNPTNFLHSPIHIQKNIRVSTPAVAIVALFGLAMAIAVGLLSRMKKGREEGYQPIMAQSCNPFP